MSNPTEFESPDDELEFDIDVEQNDEGNPEVELADEDAEPEAEQEQEPQPEPEAEEPEAAKPHRNRAKERIAELSRRAAEAEHRAAEAERRAREYEERMEAASVAQVEQAETALKSEIAMARRELVEAKALGDYEREAEATARIAELSASMAQVRMYRESAKPVSRQEMQQQSPVPSQPVVEPKTASWINQNSWFNPQSPDYDPEMAVDTQAYARKLEIRLQREGRQNEIGSDEYFAVIDEYVRQQYPDAFDDAPPPPKKRMPSMSAGRDVAPVARQTAPVQPAPKKSSVRLTADQREMAERMFPNATPQEAWTKYARYI